jgi:hypothetical protein
MVNVMAYFLNVYPREVAAFDNPNPAKIAGIDFDRNYNGVAYTSAGNITISSAWFNANPNAFGYVAHEAMHVLQAYKSNNVPSWLVEGIADYARYRFGGVSECSDHLESNYI